MKNKKEFLKPEAELVEFSNEDIITGSGVTIGDSEVPWYENQD